MAMYIGEEDVWKCLKHPSKRHRSGICPVCLRDRLVVLCPECANLLPCSCYASSSSSSSASSSSGFSFFSSLSSSRDGGGRVSDLIDREPAFRRSRSVGIPYLFSRFASEKIMNQRPEPPIRSNSMISWFLSKFKMNSTRKRAEIEKKNNNNEESDGIHAKSRFDAYVCRNSNTVDFASVMMKSRSVQLPMKTSGYVKSPAVMKRGWSFRSPMKAFRHSPKASKVIQHQKFYPAISNQ